MAYNPLNLGRPLEGHDAFDATTSSSIDTNVVPASSALDSVDSHPHPRLEHTHTAPTTIPTRRQSHNGSESPTPTLHTEIPPTAGGAPGQPLAGHHVEKGDFNEKDHQAAGAGGQSGPGVAALAKKELGIDTNTETDAFNEKSYNGPPSPSASKNPRLDRTATGTQVNRGTHTGGDTVQGLGMVPITRKTSQPPGVGIFGGVAPSGVDAEEGLAPVRSHEEEEEREILRKAQGPDPWSVRFEEGDKANPKVSRHIRVSLPSILNSTMSTLVKRQAGLS